MHPRCVCMFTLCLPFLVHLIVFKNSMYLSLNVGCLLATLNQAIQDICNKLACNSSKPSAHCLQVVVHSLSGYKQPKRFCMFILSPFLLLDYLFTFPYPFFFIKVINNILFYWPLSNLIG